MEFRLQPALTQYSLDAEVGMEFRLQPALTQYSLKPEVVWSSGFSLP